MHSLVSSLIYMHMHFLYSRWAQIVARNCTWEGGSCVIPSTNWGGSMAEACWSDEESTKGNKNILFGLCRSFGSFYHKWHSRESCSLRWKFMITLTQMQMEDLPRKQHLCLCLLNWSWRNLHGTPNVNAFLLTDLVTSFKIGEGCNVCELWTHVTECKQLV